jgi:hypothetical protein
MHPQSHTSPDGLLTLTSEPTLTINDAHPEGFNDWIISIEPGGWHTHPNAADPEGSTEQLIRGILEDRTILAVTYHDTEIHDVAALYSGETLEEAVQSERSRATPGWTITFRLWSGTILATAP